MAPTREIVLDCDFVGMGPPDPARVVIMLEDGQGDGLVTVTLTCHFPWRTTTGSSAFHVDSLIGFADSLERLRAGSMQRVELVDWDLGSTIALWADPERADVFGLSGRFYDGVTDLDDPDDGFFGPSALVTGFQGMGLAGGSMSRLVTELGDFLEEIGVGPQGAVELFNNTGRELANIDGSSEHSSFRIEHLANKRTAIRPLPLGSRVRLLVRVNYADGGGFEDEFTMEWEAPPPRLLHLELSGGKVRARTSL